MTYRTGNPWGVTIVREDPPHPAQLVAVVTTGDVKLAERICALLNGDGAVARECAEETRSWDHFTAEQMDSYWIRCTLLGPHDEHKDENTGLTWRTPRDGDAPSGPLSAPVAVQEPPVGGTGPTGGAEAISGRYASYVCPVPGHQGCDPWNCRWAPEEPPAALGCICNDPPPTVDKPKNGTASRPPGWACPRHGAVI